MKKWITKALVVVVSLSAVLGGITTSPAANYYVSITGNNANNGSQSNPWRTIQYAAGRVNAGDTVRVSDGVYNERVTIQRSGSPGNFINFVGNATGTGVVMYGFSFVSASYNRIIGFEIRHVNTTYRAGIHFASGTSDYNQIIDNYIHDTLGEGIRGYPATVRNLVVRGNRLDYLDHPGSLGRGDSAIGSSPITPDYWLVEYNVITRTVDFSTVYGQHIIQRNNVMLHFNPADFSSPGHSDIFQPGSDGQNVGTKHHVVERNFTGDSPTADSHFGLWQDTVNAGDTNILIRGNVGYNLGNAGIGIIGTDKVQTYNNTFHDMLNESNGNVWNWYRTPTVGGLLANSITSDYGQSRDAINIDAGQVVKATHNLGYLSGSEASYVSTSNPLFVNASSQNFRLQAGSPAINAGTNIAWVTSAAGSGTTFNINDGQLFIDGWGIAEGDVITVGGTTTRISSISGDSVTVATSVTWTNGMPVYWGTDTSPDIGAFPYGSTELTGATMTQNGTTYTVSPTGDARGVWFYVDGIPTIWDYEVPYTATIPGGVVTAKAYALWAQQNPVVFATNASGPLPAPPGNLRVQPPN